MYVCDNRGITDYLGFLGHNKSALSIHEKTQRNYQQKSCTILHFLECNTRNIVVIQELTLKVFVLIGKGYEI